MVTMVCWNIAWRKAAWRFLLGCGADIALLQETSLPPDDVAEQIEASEQIEVDPAPFHDADGNRLSRAAIVKLSDRVQVEWLEPVPIAVARRGDFVESQPGSIAAAVISAPGVAPFIAASICAAYDNVHRSVGKSSIVDASVHRVISDLSLLIGHIRRHRIVAAGDLTVWHGYGNNDYWKGRNDTVFDRMEAIGLPLVGPQYPHGRQADPWPTWLPEDSLNVPTYYNIGGSPAMATGQLDYVFASKSMADSVKVRALNGVEEWGPSDHCRIEIVVT
ncbi:MAG: hypothetical protein OXM62_00135 [bacterium]|nr:hypothetical protein [bacterium]MDE0233399.1 hypothetical protein [bacterium]